MFFDYLIHFWFSNKPSLLWDFVIWLFLKVSKYCICTKEKNYKIKVHIHTISRKSHLVDSPIKLKQNNLIILVILSRGFASLGPPAGMHRAVTITKYTCHGPEYPIVHHHSALCSSPEICSQQNHIKLHISPPPAKPLVHIIIIIILIPFTTNLAIMKCIQATLISALLIVSAVAIPVAPLCSILHCALNGVYSTCRKRAAPTCVSTSCTNQPIRCAMWAAEEAPLPCNTFCSSTCDAPDTRPVASNGRAYCNSCYLRRASCLSDFTIVGPLFRGITFTAFPSPTPSPNSSPTVAYPTLHAPYPTKPLTSTPPMVPRAFSVLPASVSPTPVLVMLKTESVQALPSMEAQLEPSEIPDITPSSSEEPMPSPLLQSQMSMSEDPQQLSPYPVFMTSAPDTQVGPQVMAFGPRAEPGSITAAASTAALPVPCSESSPEASAEASQMPCVVEVTDQVMSASNAAEESQEMVQTIDHITFAACRNVKTPGLIAECCRWFNVGCAVYGHACSMTLPKENTPPISEVATARNVHPACEGGVTCVMTELGTQSPVGECVTVKVAPDCTKQVCGSYGIAFLCRLPLEETVATCGAWANRKDGGRKPICDATCNNVCKTGGSLKASDGSLFCNECSLCTASCKARFIFWGPIKST